MKKLYSLLLLVCLSATAVAQQKFELGKPNNEAYRYLDNYKALKEYVDHEKYPNFKLGAGTTVNEYLSNSLVKNLINKNFNETVAGNAMKMASCVKNNGSMDFTTVKNYVNTATEFAGRQARPQRRSVVPGDCQQGLPHTADHGVDG